MAAANYSWNHTVTIPGSSYDVIFDKLSRLSSEITQKILNWVEIEEGKNVIAASKTMGTSLSGEDDYEHEDFKLCTARSYFRQEQKCFIVYFYPTMLGIHSQTSSSMIILLI